MYPYIKQDKLSDTKKHDESLIILMITTSFKALRYAFIIDPLETLSLQKDSTLMMVESAQKKGIQTTLFTLNELFVENGIPQAFTAQKKIIPLSDFDVIFMRKDPPFDMEYITATYILQLAQDQGVRVINPPNMLRNYNEKFVLHHFPKFAPPTLVSRNHAQLKQFHMTHSDIVLKPLDGMGGVSIFRVQRDDPNLHVILDTLTHHQTRYIMAQPFLPKIVEGDKRILLFGNQVYPSILARIPAHEDWRGNMAAGASTLVREILPYEHAIAQQIAHTLSQKGILLTGLDMIGDKITEINITSPTGFKQIYDATQTNPADHFIQYILN